MRKKDFATGKSINENKPEEKVRQAYERILHHDFGYPRECMDIEVSVPMGADRRRCDIAVYAAADKKKIIGIVETKPPKQSYQRGQLESYMAATASCQWGVWTNGEETRYFQRKADGIVSAVIIPRFNETGAGIPNFASLKPASNLKWIFRQINNSLYANTNLPRSEKQGAEMVRLIFCKLTDEYAIRNKTIAPEFQVLDGETARNTRRRINALWKKTQEGRVGRPIFKSDEKIEIDDSALSMIVGKLQGYSLLKTQRDVVGDAFEIFAERHFAGEKGQFFTPRSVVQMVVDMLAPNENETIIDPACGSGGFLIAALNHIAGDDAQEKQRIAEHCLYGMDKDADLSKICKAQMSILGDGKSNIVTADSLNPRKWDDTARSKMLEDDQLRQFDIVMTNPPFGSKIKVESKEVLRNYDLGHAWKIDQAGEWSKQNKTKQTPPQVLFIELCVRLLKPGGRLGIVLPDGLLGNPRDGYIRAWLKDKTRVLAVVDCPTATFAPHTSTKTSVLLLQKLPADDVPRPYMAIAEECGHTPRGTEIFKEEGRLREDFSTISHNYLEGRSRQHLGFRPSLVSDILVPRYYDPRILRDIRHMQKSGNAVMTSISKFVEQGQLEVLGVPSSASSENYDLHGNIRFVRTSDISSYEIAAQTQINVSQETYDEYKATQNMRQGDILFVKDGDSKIGATAILLDEEDTKILVQTHFRKLRARAGLDPFLLLGLLDTPIVKRQVRQRVFSQSTLRTIGNRIYELQLPVPADKKRRENFARLVRQLVMERRAARRRLQQIING